MTKEAICKWVEGDDWQWEGGWDKVQPLIRCKDCIYKEERSYCMYYYHFKHWTDDLDYCSHGKKRRDTRNG